MIYPITVVLFFLYCWGLGLGLGLFVKESEDFLERNIMRLGLGLGALPALGLLLNLIKIPLDWKIFLFISIVPVAILIIKSFRNHSSVFGILKGIRINAYVVIMLALFFVSFYMYGKGAFAYPYLEDDDSWNHAIGTKFVSIEKTVFDDAKSITYIDPYPPTYDMLFGILHQTNDSVYWTLKFFNALIVSLSIVFFYFFVKVFTTNSKKALFSAFALFAVPAFLSHFIWALALTVPLYFVSFYAVEKIRDDKKWWVVAATVMVTALTSSPSHSVYFGLFFLLYLISRIIIEKKFLIYEFLAGFTGLLLSFILWWLPVIIRYGFEGFLKTFGIEGIGSRSVGLFSVGGTGDRIYTLQDFIFAKRVNMINNPIGIGIVLSLLVVLALTFLIYRNYTELKKFKLIIVPAFLILNSIILVLLSRTYAGQLWEEKAPAALSQFFSEQSFLVLMLSIIIFIWIMLVVINYKTGDVKEKYILVVLTWLMFTFYAVNAGPFNYKLSPFRAWMLLAIPVSLLSGEAVYSINNIIKSLVKGLFNSSNIVVKIAPLLVVGIIAYGIIATSFIQKYSVNTALWGPGGFWTSNEEIQGYVWFKDNIPKGNKVFTFSNNALIIGFDKFICHWCEEVRSYQRNGFNQTSEQNYNWLKKEQYKYIVIDGQTAKKFGANETANKIQAFMSSNKFKPVFSSKGILIFEIA